jgi:hypothetical protein
MTETNTWSEFYKITKSHPPSELLIKALEYVPRKNKAIDLGGGALKDTRFLLEQGFEVTVIDKEDALAKGAEELGSNKLHYHISSFADFDFPKNEYDIACAIFALPFNPPSSFDDVFHKIRGSLARNGIFCGQFFGTQDEWSADPNMTFHTKKQVEKLLAGMEVILLDEKQWDGKLALGTPKHWHVFHVIARKIEI